MKKKTLEELLAEYDEAKARDDYVDKLVGRVVGVGCILVIIGIAVAFGFVLLQ